MRLFSMELRRFCLRRANLVILILGVLFLGGMLTTTLVNSHPPSPGEVAEAKELAAEEREAIDSQREDCEQWWRDHPDAGGGKPSPPDTENEEDWTEYEYRSLSGIGDCASAYDSSTVDYTGYLEYVVSFETESRHQLAFVAAIATVAALLMSSSFIGAEWSCGGMTNLLLWRPRRLPVFTAKMAAAVTGTFALTIAYGLLHIGGLWLIAKYAGDLGNLDATWWSDTADFAGRLLTLVILASVWGVALSMLGRRTIAAIGMVLGYLALVEYGLRLMMMSVSVDIQHWLLSSYMIAWLNDGTYFHGMGVDAVERYYVSGEFGGGVVLAVTAVLLAITGWMFARRDTT